MAAHFHALSDHECGVETHTELADQVVALVLDGLGEGLGARAGDGAQGIDGLLLGQAHAVVGERDGAVDAVHANVDARLTGGGGEVLLLQTDHPGLVQGIAGVGDQLPKEDLALGVEAVNDQVQELADFGVEGKGLGLGHGILSLWPLK